MESEEVGLVEMNVADLERVLTEFFAEKLELVVDASIFRGQLPPGVAQGVTVRIDGMEPASDYEEPEFIVQVLGKFEDRDDAWAMLDRLARLVPLYGVAWGGYRLAYLQTYGTGSPYTAADDGEVKIFASYNFRCALQ